MKESRTLPIAVIAILLLASLSAGCINREKEKGLMCIKIEPFAWSHFNYVNFTFAGVYMQGIIGGKKQWVQLTNKTFYVNLSSQSESSNSTGICFYAPADKFYGIHLPLKSISARLFNGAPASVLILCKNITFYREFKISKNSNNLTIVMDINKSFILLAGSIYKVVLVIEYVEMEKGGKKSQLYDINIPNRNPIAIIVANGNKTISLNAKVNETITFDATKSFDVDGDTLNYLWDFGDGTTSTEKIVNHTYSQPGSYTIYLTVSDGKLSDSMKMAVNVIEEK